MKYTQGTAWPLTMLCSAALVGNIVHNIEWWTSVLGKGHYLVILEPNFFTSSVQVHGKPGEQISVAGTVENWSSNHFQFFIKGPVEHVCHVACRYLSLAVHSEPSATWPDCAAITFLKSRAGTNSKQDQLGMNNSTGSNNHLKSIRRGVRSDSQ